MPFVKRLRYTLIITSILLLISACNSGSIAGIDRSGSPPVTEPTPDNTDPTLRMTSGPIDGFGSVIVNGVRYNTDLAEIFVSGLPADESNLRIGDYVTVEGEIDSDGNGYAYSVYYQPSVTGQISSINEELQQIVILGQTIQITGATSFDTSFSPLDFSALCLDDFITISGPNAGDMVFASRVGYGGKRAVGYELSGKINNLDRNSQTFSIQDQKVAYGKVALFDDIEEGESIAIDAGSIIINIDGVPTSILNASEIRHRGEASYVKTEGEVEIAGFVWDIKDKNNFKVNEINVRLNNGTNIINGSRNDINKNQRVRIIGVYIDDLLEVKELTLTPLADTKISGSIINLNFSDDDDDSDESEELAEFFTDDHWVIVTKDTRLTEVGNNTSDSAQLLSDIRLGDTIIVSGRKEGKRIIAHSLELDRSISAN